MKWLFCPLPQGKFFDGTTIYTEPLGGSESSVVYLARALARKGEEVIVLGHMPPNQTEPKPTDDVIYMPQSMIAQLIRQSWDTVVSVRWPYVLNELNWNTHVPIIWIHDMPSPDFGYRARHAVFLTEWHQNAWQLSNENSVVIGNGIDPSLYKGDKANEKGNKLIWTSNPDRGTAIAAMIFQDIRKAWPDLELHIYGRASVYGWDAEAESPFLPRPQHMENVFVHESVKKSVLAKKLADSWALFYPTYWPETFCIATLEAQAAGLPCVVPPFGALPETVKGGIVSYDFKNSISLLRNVRKWQKCAEAGIEHAASSTWEDRADVWINLVRQTIKEAEGGSKVETRQISEATRVEQI